MSLNQYQIILEHGDRRFTTLSNLPQEQVLGNGHKWDRLIIMLHGFPDTNTTFNPIWQDLEAAFGQEQLLLVAPKMRGYEPSSQGPESQYTVTEIADDVKCWIETLNPDGERPVHIIGHDWGAVIAYKTASLYPHLVTSMVTLAIPYLAETSALELLWYAPEQLYLSSYFLTMVSSRTYEPKLSDKNCRYIRKLWRYWSPSYDLPDKVIREVGETFNERGVAQAASAYYRRVLDPVNLIESRRWPVDFSKVPTLILTGEEDGCMGIRLQQLEARKLKDIPQVEFKILPNQGHFLQREQPEQIARLAVDFLEKYGK